MPTGFSSVEEDTRTQIKTVIIKTVNIDYRPGTGVSRISPADLKCLFPSAISLFQNCLFSAAPVYKLKSLMSLTSTFHGLKTYYRVRRESKLQEIKILYQFFFYLWRTTSTLIPFQIIENHDWHSSFFTNCRVAKGDRDCYSVNAISEHITQSFVICQKHKQKQSMCHSLQKVSGFIA